MQDTTWKRRVIIFKAWKTMLSFVLCQNVLKLTVTRDCVDDRDPVESSLSDKSDSLQKISKSYYK